jgi:hypothetical protein
VVACGRTALARGWEYVGIGVAAGWVLVTAGRILLRAGGNDIALAHQRAATFAGLNALGPPQGISYDYRGWSTWSSRSPAGGPT